VAFFLTLSDHREKYPEVYATVVCYICGIEQSSIANVALLFPKLFEKGCATVALE